MYFSPKTEISYFAAEGTGFQLMENSHSQTLFILIFLGKSIIEKTSEDWPEIPSLETLTRASPEIEFGIGHCFILD